MGFSHIIAYTAFAVGATLVAFQGTPAKQRRIRRLDDGHIDMDAVHADPPVQMSPRGSSVIQAVFLAPTSIDARARAEAALTCSHVPTNP
jgi:imidazoleglycerol phosphate dehydratase HisB